MYVSGNKSRNEIKGNLNLLMDADGRMAGRGACNVCLQLKPLPLMSARRLVTWQTDWAHNLSAWTLVEQTKLCPIYFRSQVR